MASSTDSNEQTSSPRLLASSEYTKWKTIRFDMTWTIPNFNMYRHTRQTLCSTGISMAQLGRKDYPGRWRMRVGPSRKSREKLSVRLILTDLTGAGIQDEEASLGAAMGILRLDFGIIPEGQASDSSQRDASDSDQRDIYASAKLRVTTGRCADALIFEGSIRYVFNAKASSSGHSICTYDALFGSDGQPGQIRDKCITITMLTTLTVPQTSSSLACTGQKEYLARQVEWAVSEEKYASDFVLRSMDGREFFTSPLLLTAHSPVFSAMLKNDTTEKRLMRCEMEDVDGETLDIVLTYLYSYETGKINGHNVEKVFIMADKYQLMHLRDLSQEILASNITMDNAVNCLRFAILHKLKDLKLAALSVIDKNIAVILSDREIVQASDPEIFRTIITHCADKARLAATTWISGLSSSPSQSPSPPSNELQLYAAPIPLPGRH